MIERRIYLPDSDKKRIVSLFKKGENVPALAQLFGVSEGTVYRFTKHLRDVKPRPNRGSVLARARNRIGIW
jgi:transposase